MLRKHLPVIGSRKGSEFFPCSRIQAHLVNGKNRTLSNEIFEENKVIVIQPMLYTPVSI